MTSAGSTDVASGRAPASLEYRPVRPDELPACAEVWRVSIDDYVTRLGQPEVPPDAGRCCASTPTCRPPTPTGSSWRCSRTSPRRAASGSWRSPPPCCANGSGSCPCASSCRRCRARAWGAPCSPRSDRPSAPMSPGPPRRTARSRSPTRCTPPSGSSRAIPLLNLVGHPMRPEAFGTLPSGIRPVSFEELAGGPPGGDGHARLCGRRRRPRPCPARRGPSARSSLPATGGPARLAVSRPGRGADRVRLCDRGRSRWGRSRCSIPC